MNSVFLNSFIIVSDDSRQRTRLLALCKLLGVERQIKKIENHRIRYFKWILIFWNLAWKP
jgi:hypothetical protein